MAFIGSLLGAGKGSDFQAAGSPVATTNPTSQGQINQSYFGTQDAMGEQRALLQALQSQSGVANQSQVYNQLQGVASGQGVNPAQAQYRQNVQDLAKQQSGAISSIQGISPALQARMIAQQGSSAMQNAAGQGAVNQGNQQIAAMNAAGQMANTQASNQIGQTNANTSAAQAEYQAQMQAQNTFGQTQAGILGNMNTTNSATQIQNSKAQAGLFGGAFSFLAEGGEVKGYDAGGPVQQTVTAPSPFTAPQFQGPQSSFGKYLNGYGSAPQQGPQGQQGSNGENPFSSNQFDGLGHAIGKNVFGLKEGERLSSKVFSAKPDAGSDPSMAGADYEGTSNMGAQSGSSIDAANTPIDAGEGLGAEEGASAAEGAEGAEAAEGASAAEGAGAAASEDEGIGELVAALAKGGKVKGGKKVDALVSPGELWLPPEKVAEVARGKNPMKAGQRIPGKPKVAGNSYANDTVPKKLEVGGVVIPNSIMQSKNPAQGAKDFIDKIIAKRRARG